MNLALENCEEMFLSNYRILLHEIKYEFRITNDKKRKRKLN